MALKKTKPQRAVVKRMRLQRADAAKAATCCTMRTGNSKGPVTLAIDDEPHCVRRSHARQQPY